MKYNETDMWLDLCAWCGSTKYMIDKKFREDIDKQMDKLSGGEK